MKDSSSSGIWLSLLNGIRGAEAVREAARLDLEFGFEGWSFRELSLDELEVLVRLDLLRTGWPPTSSITAETMSTKVVDAHPV